MKLSTYAKKLGITYRTAFNYYQKGMIKGAYQLNTGTIIVPEEIKNKPEYTVIYARVSSSENKSNLESQAKRLQQFCYAKGWIINEIIKECASGLNDKRPKLQKIFNERKATRLIIEHKDRLTRFGFEYIKTLFQGCEIIVVNETDNKEDDIMQDFISIITSFCARIYGNRRSYRKTEKIIKELKNEID